MLSLSSLAALLAAAEVLAAPTAATGPTRLPSLHGPYLQVREKLRALGYKPVKVHPPFAVTCVDSECHRTRHTSEGICAADRPFCVFYWRAPTGRNVRIDTVGEVNFGQVSKVSWTTPADFKDL